MGVLKNVSNSNGLITTEGHDSYFTNRNSVENLICNITMTKRVNEQPERLIVYGGKVIDILSGVPMMVHEICGLYGCYGEALDSRDNIYHEVFCLEDKEVELLHYSVPAFWDVGMELYNVYFRRGFPAVFALHEEWGCKFHYHFAVSMVNDKDGSVWMDSLDTLTVRERRFNDILHEYIEAMMNVIVPVTFDSSK